MMNAGSCPGCPPAGEHNPGAGLSEAQASAEAREQASNVLAGLATLHVAEAHALQGDRTLCEKALATADGRLNRVEDSDAAIDLYSQTQAGRMAGS
jgi:hypothetical protein